MATDDPALLEEFTSIARKIDEFDFFTTTEHLSREVYPDITNFPAVILLKDFDEKRVVFAGSWADRVFDFIRGNQFPMVGKVDREVMDIIFKASTRKYVVLFRSAAKNSARSLDAEFRELASSRKSSKYYFLISDIKDEQEQRLVDYLGLEEKDLPVVEILEETEGELNRYRNTGRIQNRELKQFLANFEDGKIKRFLKSEEIPKNNDGPVVKIVGKNFQSEVIDSKDDVFLLFYAEWCGHCKKVKPTIKELAEKLKGVKGIKIAEVDATKNDLVGHVVHGFPTMKLFQANNKNSPVEFEGNRTINGFLGFIKNNAHNKLELPEIKTDL